jgi:hypothetical protein
MPRVTDPAKLLVISGALGMDRASRLLFQARGA